MLLMMILNSYIAFTFPLPETLLGIKSTHYVYINPESINRKKTKTLASNDLFYTEMNSMLTSSNF